MYVLGTPWFKEVEIQLENGKTFTITADHPSPTFFCCSQLCLIGFGCGLFPGMKVITTSSKPKQPLGEVTLT
ncbi:MAG: glycoside hydrolase family 92 protein [Paludibacteraceae bacterium]|nr:glycoside hydrolase family 92 protein [Paludibacteraceae bacterium]